MISYNNIRSQRAETVTTAHFSCHGFLGGVRTEIRGFDLQVLEPTVCSYSRWRKSDRRLCFSQQLLKQSCWVIRTFLFTIWLFTLQSVTTAAIWHDTPGDWWSRGEAPLWALLSTDKHGFLLPEQCVKIQSLFSAAGNDTSWHLL